METCHLTLNPPRSLGPTTGTHFEGKCSIKTPRSASTPSEYPSKSFAPFTSKFTTIPLIFSSGVSGETQELANQASISLDDGESNKGLVIALYAAFRCRDVDAVHRLLAPDLEWWFHGPPSDQFLMRLLTGSDADDSKPFRFKPLSIAAFGPLILAEGCDPGRSIAWVHAWTVTDGIITHVREYFNTSVTVTRLGNDAVSPTPSEPSTPSDSEITADVVAHNHCQPIWESRVSDRFGKSVPGLVLAL